VQERYRGGHTVTATYDPTLPTDADRVRLLTGDTDTDNARFSDEEIDALLVSPGGVYSTCAALFDGLAAQYSTRVDLSVDGFSTKSGMLAENFVRMANRFRGMAATEDAGGIGVPTVAGISEDAIEAVRDDLDRVPNRFTHDMMLNPPSNTDYTAE